MSRWARAARPWVVLAAGVAVTTAAAALPPTLVLDVGAAGPAALHRQGAAEPVRAASLSCPGPETEGIAGVAPVAGPRTTVLAAAAPAEALAGLPAGAAPDSAPDAALTVRSSGTPVASTADRGTTVSASLSGATSAEVSATGSLAAGLSALQTVTRRDGDDRGLQALPCSAAAGSVFLLGGGGGSTRRERLVIANPGGNPVTADLQVYGASGPLAPAGSRVTVPARGRVGMLLDSLAPGEPTPAVRVIATGGAVTALLEDSWIEGAVGRGRDDSAAAAGPATEQVIPAAVLDGPAALRLLVPGTAEALVESRLLTSQGPRPLPAEGVLRVPGGTVRDVDLTAVPAGAYAVQVRADQPVVAAVLAQHRPGGEAASDLGWAASSAAIPSVAGSPLPAGVGADLLLAATGAPSSSVVVTVGADGAVSARPVSVGADSVSRLDVTGARSVWVRRTEGTLRGGLALRVADPGGPLVSLVGLVPAAVLATSVPVRAVPR